MFLNARAISNRLPISSHFIGSMSGKSSATSAKSSRSAKSSSVHEKASAFLITHHLLKTAVKALVWFTPSVSALRLISLDDGIRNGVLQILHGPAVNGVHPFWNFYSAKSDDEPAEPWKLKQDHVEFDYFAYEDVLDASESEAAKCEEVLYPSSAFLQRPKNKALDNSCPTDERRVCIFEIGESDCWEYKLAQLELRLAVFLAKRRLKLNKEVALDDVVAACGVCIPEQYHRSCFALLANPDANMYLPSIAALHNKGRMHVLSSEGTRSVFPPLAPAPPERVWVKYGAVTFKVTPATNDVDSLKKAVKAEWEANKSTKLDVFQLTVKDHSGKVLKASALLECNTEDTAYIAE